MLFWWGKPTRFGSLRLCLPGAEDGAGVPYRGSGLFTGYTFSGQANEERDGDGRSRRTPRAPAPLPPLRLRLGRAGGPTGLRGPAEAGRLGGGSLPGDGGGSGRN